jgi:hypothetical protein
MTNTGLKFDKPDQKHWVFGSSPLPMTIIQPDGNWVLSLPKKEVQDLNGVEPYACVIFTLLNCIEILIKQQYGLDRNYSDRFLATVLGTGVNQGSSPQEACELLRNIGVPPEDIWPFDTSILTSEEFFADIPPVMYQIAEEFTVEWDFKHEFVEPTPEKITQALKCSPLMVSFAAWSLNEKGQYYRPEGMTDNHATTMFSEEVGNYRRVFDTYDPVFKDLQWSDLPTVVKRFWVKKKPAPIVNAAVNKKKSVVNWIKSFIIKIYEKIFKRTV